MSSKYTNVLVLIMFLLPILSSSDNTSIQGRQRIESIDDNYNKNITAAAVQLYRRSSSTTSDYTFLKKIRQLPADTMKPIENFDEVYIGNNERIYSESKNNNNKQRKVEEISSMKKRCIPKGIHIAQGSNIVDSTNTLSMIVSFVLDYNNCPPSLVQPILILYKQQLITTGITIKIPDNDTTNVLIQTIRLPSNFKPLQFNHTSFQEQDGKNQISPWIYHIPISNLEGGLKHYSYQIRFIQKQQQQLSHHRRVITEKVKESLTTPSIWSNQPNETQEQQSTGIIGLKEIIQSSATSKTSTTINNKSNRSSKDENHMTDTNTTVFETSFNTINETEIILGESRMYTFITPPLPGQPTTLVFAGDIGQTEDSKHTMMNVLERIQKTWNSLSIIPSPITNILIAGDMTYADSNLYRWDNWFTMFESVFSTVPVSVTVGNHEIECNSKTGMVFVPYEYYFRVPNRNDNYYIEPIALPNTTKDNQHHLLCVSSNKRYRGVYNYGNSFYSYHHGMAHIIVLNSYSDTSQSSEQYKWLVGELKYNVNRTITPWLIVMFHVPFYTTFRGHAYESSKMKRSIEYLFTKYYVNIIISGHDHAYQRTYPIAAGGFGSSDATNTDRAPIYVTVGAGGNREGHVKKGYRFKRIQEFWISSRNNNQYGYALLQITNATHAFFQWISNNSNNSTTTKEKVFHDETWIRNYL